MSWAGARGAGSWQVTRGIRRVGGVMIAPESDVTVCWPLPKQDYWSTPFAEALLHHRDLFPGAYDPGYCVRPRHPRVLSG